MAISGSLGAESPAPVAKRNPPAAQPSPPQGAEQKTPTKRGAEEYGGGC